MEKQDPRFNQEKLTDLSPYRSVDVMNVGGGAVGSYDAELEAKMGVKRITINDIDHYEADNASKTSSIVRLNEGDGESDVGRWKAEALAVRTQASMIKGGRANAIVGNVENLGPMAFSAFNYVCAAPDNKAVREYINQQLKMLPPGKRPVYIVGGTDGEMATSAIFTDLDSACYRCMCEENSFKSSRRRTSCAEAQYRFTKEGKAEQIIVSNLSSVKAALLMADDLRAKATGKLPFKNRSREWNPDSLFPPILSNEIRRRCDCPDCAKIKAPKKIRQLEGDALSTSLRSVMGQIKTALGTDHFALSAHLHRFGEDSFFEFVKRDYCRACGESFDLYRHTRFVASENDLLCEACRKHGAQTCEIAVPEEADILYGFAPDEKDERILNATLFELGYPIGAYLWATQYDDDQGFVHSERICFTMSGDPVIVKQNINLMEE